MRLLTHLGIDNSSENRGGESHGYPRLIFSCSTNILVPLCKGVRAAEESIRTPNLAGGFTSSNRTDIIRASARHGSLPSSIDVSFIASPGFRSRNLNQQWLDPVSYAIDFGCPSFPSSLCAPEVAYASYLRIPVASCPGRYAGYQGIGDDVLALDFEP